MRFLLLAILLLSSWSVFGDVLVEQAIKASGAKPSDRLEKKIFLLLHLLNDEHYLSESNPNPKYKDVARFSSTSKTEAHQLLSHYSKNSSGGLYGSYDLDSARTPKEMLKQRIGGNCGTKARVFADLLEQMGVSENDLRIVSAVTTGDYSKMCPQGQSKKLNSVYNGGASGHVFVLIKVAQEWKLINTTYSPFDQKAGPHVKAVMKTLTFADIEAVTFQSPSDLQKKLDQGIPVLVPEFQSLPEFLPGDGGPINFRKMIVFEVIAPKSYDLHTWKDRYNIIASGNKASDVCRFTLK